jgi:hypothetical protein
MPDTIGSRSGVRTCRARIARTKKAVVMRLIVARDRAISNTPLVKEFLPQDADACGLGGLTASR